ncbi:hypothetical protein GALL_500060 [mine drainage metagenome]|uniref:Uncharacterized protein n=1 Tax=mine drainage metagenome TaxID=410659 RepID=A0A1J5PB13_9ZZZZ
MHGHIRAAAGIGHGHTHVSGGQRRSVVDTIAHHHHDLPALPQGGNVRRLVAGQDIADDLARLQADPHGHGQRCRLVVARQHQHANTLLTQGCNGPCGAGFGLIAKGQQGQYFKTISLATRHSCQCRAPCLKLLKLRLKAMHVGAQFLDPLGAADKVINLVDAALQAFARRTHDAACRRQQQ